MNSALRRLWPILIATLMASWLPACASEPKGPYHVTISTSVEITRPPYPSTPSSTTPTNTSPGSSTTTLPAFPETPDPSAPVDLNAVRAALDALPIASALPPIRYDRERYFGGWVDADHDCQDTRAEVLVAESHSPVAFADSGSCRVSTGTWNDAYTGEVITDASRLDIDHFIPLEAAWISGAWQWSTEQRIAFSNDLQHPEALVAVTASANRSKGSRGPAEWKPPLTSTWCNYAATWTIIKARWSLTTDSPEKAALEAMLQGC